MVLGRNLMLVSRATSRRLNVTPRTSRALQTMGLELRKTSLQVAQPLAGLKVRSSTPVV